MIPQADPLEREFPFEQRHFEMLRALAREEAGIELADSKRELVYGRLARRVRALRLDGFDDYCRLVKDKHAPERANFVNSITTNVTSFFREGHHFDYLRDEALPALLESRSGSRRLRIWSAACSTGQEPYSIAITVAETLPAQADWDCKILATDIDSNVVSRAAAGIYPRDAIPDLDSDIDVGRWFQPTPDGGGTVQADPALRRMCYFRELNLMDPWPMSGPIDIIFCRNVLIYFSKDTQAQLFRRYADLLAPDGYLFIGHSESVPASITRFKAVGRTIYRAVGGSR